MCKICILGNDNRSEYLRRLYINEGLVINHFSESDYVICPIPFTRDNVYITDENVRIDELIFTMKKNKSKLLITGGLNNSCIEKLEKNNIEYIDILKKESFVKKNAFATAEGTIKIIMDNIITTILDSKIMIIGYGRIGTYLGDMLKNLGADVTVCARRNEVLDSASQRDLKTVNIKDVEKIIQNQDIIVNTVPAIVLDKNILKKVNKNCIIIDVASNPGGIEYMEADKLGIKSIWSLAIPSKYCPLSAAKYVKEETDKLIHIKNK